jgi:hypothetical protein
MRVIEEKMVAALKARKTWTGGNTQVVSGSAFSSVYLFDKHIATYSHDTNKLEVNERTLVAWPTATTASRLNALFRGLHLDGSVSVRKGGPFINDVRIV